MPAAVDSLNSEENSSRYTKEDIHTIFRFSAKLQLAEAICKLDPIPSVKVQILLDSCPYPSLDDLQVEKEEYYHAVSTLVGFRTQESVLAIAHFFLCSNGQFENEIIPRLNSYLDILTKLKFPDSATILSAENFTYHLVKQFAYIAESIEKSRQALVSGFLQFYQNVLQHSNLPIMYGILRALGEVCFPLVHQQVKVISIELDQIIANVARCVEYRDVGGRPIPMLVMALQVLEQLTHLPIQVLEKDLCDRFYDVAHYFSIEHKPQPEISAYVHIVQLMVRLAMCSSRVGDKVHVYLIDMLSEKSLRNRFGQDSSSQAILDAVPFFQAVLRGLAELAEKNPHKAAKMLEPIKNFILISAPSRISLLVREEAMVTICKILRVEMIHVGVEAPRQLINSLFGILYPYFNNASTGASSTVIASPLSSPAGASVPLPVDNPLHTVIPLLGRITCALDDTKVTEIVMPNFISRISYPPTEMDVLMLEQLTAIALLGQQNSTTEVVNTMVNLFKKIVKDPNQGLIVNTIPNALHNLAVGLTNSKLKQDLCKKMLKLFQQLGKEVIVSSEGFEQNYSNPILKGMGFLLPTIAELCHNSETTPDDITLKLFQSAWFYCTLFKFTYSGTWRSDWLEAVARLAVDMPTLTTSKTNLYLEMEFELGSIVKQGFQKDEFAQMRARLLAAIPTQAVNIRNLTNPATAYLLSVLTLETMRVKAGSFKTVFSYLEDQGIPNVYVMPCLRAIADVVFSDFLTLVASQGASEKREQHLVEHTEFLLVNFCNSVAPVREAADEYISQMLAKFPQILWSKDCLCTLMELLECVARGASTLPMEVISVTLPSTGYVLDLPEDTAGRGKLLSLVVQLCSIWLKNGLQHATMETHAVLQEYMLGFQGLIQRHIGVSLALEVGSYHNSLSEEEREAPLNSKAKQAPPPARPTLPSCYNSNASVFVNNLEMKAIFSGEVKGMLKMMAHDNVDLCRAVESILLTDFRTLLSQFSLSGVADINAVRSAIYRAAAFLVMLSPTVITSSASTADRQAISSMELLHHVCWVPVRIFTPESMEAGVAAWEWLLCERPDLGVQLMSGIFDAWAWTVDSRIGLFSKANRPPNPLAITSQPAGLNVNRIASLAHVPHRIWLKFLEERFAVVRHSNREQLDILTKMLHKATADPHALSVQVESLGTRFELLLLCMKTIQFGQQPTTNPTGNVRDSVSIQAGAYAMGNGETLVGEYLLRERVYAAALTWFYYEPIWYHPNDRAELEVDVRILIDFCKSLVSEKISETDPRASVNPRHNRTNSFGGPALTDSMMSFSTVNTNTLLSASATLGSGVGTARSASVDLIGMGLASMGHNSYNSQSLNALRNDLSSVGNSSVNIDIAKVKNLRRKRLLLILLVGHEIERITVWDNPLNRTKYQIPGSQQFIYEKLPKQLKMTMSEYVHVAWSISSRLAVQLGQRFPQAQNVHKVLQELIIREPTRAFEIPEALHLVVTPEAVRVNGPELKSLLYWSTSSATPPMALALLGRAFQTQHAQSPLVTQYAVRVLRSFSPSTIIFYLPQLVQTLRYDNTGYVEGYLAEAAKGNELLAHQLIWNLQTYIDPDAAASLLGTPDDFVKKAQRLRDRVVAEMDPKALRTFRDEFQFFDNFTTISGKLLKVEAAQRRSALKEELRQLRVDSGTLYLPTNPSNVVAGIEVDTAVTLQSAAKVPILIFFKVYTRDLTVSAPSTPTSSSRALSSLANHSGERQPSAGSIQVPGEKEKHHHHGALHNAIHNALNHASHHSHATHTSHTSHTSHASHANGSLAPLANEGSRPASPLNVAALSVGSLVHSASASAIVPLGNMNAASRRSARRLSTIERPLQATPNTRSQGCIFKSGDDIRQDMLALQIIDIFKRIFQSVGLDLYLFPYKVIATKPGCGIIELVPNTMSRDQLGKKVEGSLCDYFLAKYGPKNSASFQTARRNFIQSMAAYAVVSYILQIKDRHNGNILVDEDGHIVHIDFGFIFDISPGGDMRFESSPFKLSQEMIDIMGGKPNAEQFVWFMELGVRAFMAARQHMDAIITMVDLMLDTQLPCFKELTLQNLRNRFCPDKSETEAAKFMAKVMSDAFASLNSFKTYFYDVFQYLDNGIDM